MSQVSGGLTVGYSLGGLSLVGWCLSGVCLGYLSGLKMGYLSVGCPLSGCVRVGVLSAKEKDGFNNKTLVLPVKCAIIINMMEKQMKILVVSIKI